MRIEATFTSSVERSSGTISITLFAVDGWGNEARMGVATFEPKLKKSKANRYFLLKCRFYLYKNISLFSKEFSIDRLPIYFLKHLSARIGRCVASFFPIITLQSEQQQHKLLSHCQLRKTRYLSCFSLFQPFRGFPKTIWWFWQIILLNAPKAPWMTIQYVGRICCKFLFTKLSLKVWLRTS